MTLNPSVLSKVSLAQGEKILHVSPWAKGGMIAQILLISLPLAAISLSAMSKGGETLGVGIGCGLIAAISCVLAYLSWEKRSAVVTTRNVIFFADLSKAVRAIPLEQINQVTVAPGLVTVRTGSIFNTLQLWVPDSAALAEKIEQSRQAR